MNYYLSIFLALDTGSGKNKDGDNAGNYKLEAEELQNIYNIFTWPMPSDIDLISWKAGRNYSDMQNYRIMGEYLID